VLPQIIRPRVGGFLTRDRLNMNQEKGPTSSGLFFCQVIRTI
jgi:hypothetical protein